MRILSLPILFVFLFVFFNCEDSNPTKQTIDYRFFNLQQQGWKSKRVTQSTNDINYSATEVPLYYYLLKNIGADYQKIDSIYNLHSNERIIEVEFQHSNQTDLLLEEFTKKPYEDGVKYMAFEIEKDFTVVTSSNDTIKCSGTHFERNFKVAPFKRVLLYFGNIPPEETIKLIYQDHLFGNGILKFNFKETPLKL